MEISFRAFESVIVDVEIVFVDVSKNMSNVERDRNLRRKHEVRSQARINNSEEERVDVGRRADRFNNFDGREEEFFSRLNVG